MGEDALVSVTEVAGLSGFHRQGVELADLLENGVAPRRSLLLSASLVASAEKAQRLAVRQARGLGWSWREIGEALGVSAQAAHKRFRVS